MIITLTKADFSACNIGTLTTFNVRKSTVIGATVNISLSSVERAGYSVATDIATITLNTTNYEGHAVKVMMGSTDVSSWYSSSTNKVTIPANTPITSNITISVSATAVSSGSGEETWIPMVLSELALGVTNVGTGRVSSNASRFSTVNTDTPSGILVPAGKTIYIKGLSSGTYPLRADYVYGTVNAVNPPSGSTTPIEGLVGTGSNYNSSNYFPLNTGGGDTINVQNTSDTDYYYWFGFAGLTKNESIQAEIDTYDIQYYIN